MNFRILYIAFFLALIVGLPAQNAEWELKAEWEFCQKGKNRWYKAAVPGAIHTDLFANGLIKDPFAADNEAELQWISDEEWEYRSVFFIDSFMMRHSHLEMNFNGLDTYARVYVNDTLILTSDNMFRTWSADVKPYVTLGANNLRVLFEPASRCGKQEAEKLPYTLPEGERVFTRKAQYHYGWDWGPRFVTAGIWKPITMLAWTGVKLESVHYFIRELNDSEANVDVIYESVCDIPGEYELRCLYKGEEAPKPERRAATLAMEKGRNTDTINCRIKNPRKWWSKGLGEQNTYEFRCTVLSQGKKRQSKPLAVALRSVELVRQADPLGSSFYFKVNGVPVFMKGANYIPQDNFPGRLKEGDYEQEVHLAAQANMNMLRVWGGGIYPPDEFYDACDKEGILVWQDLMFACAMYPGDEHFTSNVVQEVKEQAIRLRNHPCLALWCGNNESDEGWKNWGWQKQFNYTATDSAKIWEDYLNLFHQKIQAALRENDSQTPYWPSSPSIGWGHAESLTSGDSHYWGVWWGMEPFEMYRKKVGRFMSEYGFQGMPDWATFKDFCPAGELNLESAAVKAHQKHKSGYETIAAYMQKYYKVPSDFRHYVYASQLLQRDGMKLAIEIHRLNKMYCMGSLFWQLNDCWPVTSWSALDYYKRPKALYYSVKRSFKTFGITVLHFPKTIEVSVVSDSLKDISASLLTRLLDFKGRVIWEKTSSVQLTNTTVRTVFIDKRTLPSFDTCSAFLRLELRIDNKIAASNNFFFTAPRHLILPKANIVVKPDKEHGFTVSSTVFAKDVYLYNDNAAFVFSDNYFDLLPGVPHKVKLLTLPTDNQAGNLKIIALNNL